MENNLTIYIGWDSREKLNFDICAYSIMKHASIPVQIVALKQKTLRKAGLYWRHPDEKAATEFSLTRFLSPYLNQYKGWAVFMDCDMIITRDVAEIASHYEAQYAVKVVKHDYTPKHDVKMDGKAQHPYPRKNWSSFILWNCEHAAIKSLRPDYVSSTKVTPADLHRFSWLPDANIGALPIEYNFLVGDYDKSPNLPFNIHHTNGSPMFPGYEDADYADVWNQYKEEMLEKKHDVMGYSVLHESEVIKKAIAANALVAGKGGCGC
jgi:lipopolysaccharide biosynthesis glycosyltransferase